MTSIEQASSASPSGAALLVQRCREGDEPAWLEIVERYEGLVFGAARRQGLSVDDAADVTQATFEVLLDRLDDLREPDRLGSWLVTVTRRAAWRVRDRRQRERPEHTTDILEVVPAPNDGRGRTERALWLHDGLQELGEPCRSLLMALYLDPTGPSYAEVALRFGRPVGSIGPTRARCLDHLRRLLGDEHATDEVDAPGTDGARGGSSRG